MEQIILDLNEVLIKARKYLSELESKLISVNADHVRLVSERKDLDDKFSNFREREARVLKIENVVQLKADADALMQQASARVQAAQDAEDHLRKTSNEEMSKLNELRQSVGKESSNLELRKKELDNEVSARVKECLSNMGIKT